MKDKASNSARSETKRHFHKMQALGAQEYNAPDGRYLGPSLPSFFLISGLSYRSTFNSELRISNFPLYSI
jgi:hypothetical protein